MVDRSEPLMWDNMPLTQMSKTKSGKAPYTKGTVWRYVDFVKFVDLLQSSEFHFTRLDHLEDPYEHSLSRAAAKIDRRRFGPLVSMSTLVFEKLLSPMLNPQEVPTSE